MGRKKGSPSGGDVNPLQRMLGTYLRLERTRLGYSSADVAKRLNLTDTYYRLAESGRAALNQGLAFKVIEVFAASSVPTHDNRTISFGRFALYHVGTHWVGAEMAAREAEDGAAKGAFETLASLVADFQTLYERTQRYFELEEGTPEQKRFLEEVVAPEIGEFLRSDFYGSGAVAGKDFLKLDDVPTLNVEMILDLKQSLAGRSFVHTDQIAAKWESNRAAQFKIQRGLFRTPALIVSEANLERFHWEFLSSSRFLWSRLIFVDSGESKERLKERFVSLLNKGRTKIKGLSPISTQEAVKLEFVCLTAEQRNNYREYIESLLLRELNQHDAFWSFETHAGLDVSFIGVRGDKTENIRNLNFREASERAQLFDRLWNSVDASRED